MGSTADPNSRKHDSKDCKTLLSEIYDMLWRNKRRFGGGGTHGLQLRFAEQIMGKSPPGTDGWDTHHDEIVKQQRGVRGRLEAYERKPCGPPPPAAWHWATRPPPTPEQYKGPNWEPPPGHIADQPNSMVENAGKAAVATGLLYGGYRVVRMLPSLVPAGWWSIPLNVATP